MRILYLHGTFVPPPAEPQRDRFAWLSARIQGHVLQEIWFRRPEDVERHLGPGSFPVHDLGGLQYHFLLGRPRRTVKTRLALVWFFISQGLRLHRSHGYDCVVTYAHTLTGLCGVILKVLTGAKLIVEIVTETHSIYVSRGKHVRFMDRLSQLFSNICLHISLWSCDRVHLIAPDLIARHKHLLNVPASVFFNAVPVSLIPKRKETDTCSILLVGAPWRLKGVDLLVGAFLRLAPDFPDVTLKLLGHYPDRAELEQLTGNSQQIEILKPRSNPEVLEIMSRAAIFALPSRSEGMGRVILEAMAVGLPVVASNVGGIPSLVRDGETGFLVPSEDVLALEARLRQLLNDPILRERMGTRASEVSRTEFNEAAYVEHFTRMLQRTLHGKSDSQ
jgi:glycosyltransferase involved in cell wall biosynthesis